jgi:hypothetical protein
MSAPDILLIRNFFSRAKRVSFRFNNIPNIKEPYIELYFDMDTRKMAQNVFKAILEHINERPMRLSFLEHSGEFLSLSFTWPQYAAAFSSLPDDYSKKQYLIFIKNILYGDRVQIRLYCSSESEDIPITMHQEGRTLTGIPVTYYKREL